MARHYLYIQVSIILQEELQDWNGAVSDSQMEGCFALRFTIDLQTLSSKMTDELESVILIVNTRL